MVTRSKKRSPSNGSYKKRIGSRAEVWHGTAHHTSGGLKKGDLFKKNDRIKSRKASRAAKKNNNLGPHKQPRGSGKFGSRMSKKRSK